MCIKSRFNKNIHFYWFVITGIKPKRIITQQKRLLCALFTDPLGSGKSHCRPHENCKAMSATLFIYVCVLPGVVLYPQLAEWVSLKRTSHTTCYTDLFSFKVSMLVMYPMAPWAENDWDKKVNPRSTRTKARSKIKQHFEQIQICPFLQKKCPNTAMSIKWLTS